MGPGDTGREGLCLGRRGKRTTQVWGWGQPWEQVEACVNRSSKLGESPLLPGIRAEAPWKMLSPGD